MGSGECTYWCQLASACALSSSVGREWAPVSVPIGVSCHRLVHHLHELCGMFMSFVKEAKAYKRINLSLLFLFTKALYINLIICINWWKKGCSECTYWRCCHCLASHLHQLVKGGLLLVSLAGTSSATGGRQAPVSVPIGVVIFSVSIIFLYRWKAGFGECTY